MKLFLIFFIVFGSVQSFVFARDIIVYGSAVINGNVITARQNAYKNALEQAAMSGMVDVHSSTTMRDQRINNESFQIRTSQSIEYSEIIEEKVEGNILTVKVLAELNEPDDGCQTTTSQYRKRIAAAYFPIQHQQQIGINDYYGYDTHLSQEILQRLAASGNYLTRNTPDILLFQDIANAPYISPSTNDDETILSRIAEEKNVQYIISGVIRDLSITLESETIKSPRGLEYEIPIPIQIPSLTTFFGKQRKADKRNIIIEIYLHDTLTGELLSRHIYSRVAEGTDVIPEMPVAFGSRAFFDTSVGKVFDDILNTEIKSIQEILNCRPYTMKIIDYKDGKVYVDAGLNSKVQRGDILTVYVPDQPGEVFGIKGKSSQFGKPKSTIKIVDVYPAYSVADAEAGIFTRQDIINGYLIAW